MFALKRLVSKLFAEKKRRSCKEKLTGRELTREGLAVKGGTRSLRGKAPHEEAYPKKRFPRPGGKKGFFLKKGGSWCAEALPLKKPSHKRLLTGRAPEGLLTPSEKKTRDILAKNKRKSITRGYA